MNQPDALEPLIAHLHRTGVIAVIVLDNLADAVPLAQALLAGGIDCIELTLRTPVAFDAIRNIGAKVPEMLIGAGTILTPDQVRDAKAAGAAFGVAPGMNARVVAEAQRVELPFAPGVCTPTDIELALEQGCRLFKLFPAEPSGGLTYLRSIAAPYAHLGIQFIPLGGIESRHIEQYLTEPLVNAIGGSWLAPRALIQNRDWAAITSNAQIASTLVRRLRGGA